MRPKFIVGMFFSYTSYTVMLWGISLLLLFLFGSYIWITAKFDLFCVNIAQLELYICLFRTVQNPQSVQYLEAENETSAIFILGNTNRLNIFQLMNIVNHLAHIVAHDAGPSASSRKPFFPKGHSGHSEVKSLAMVRV